MSKVFENIYKFSNKNDRYPDFIEFIENKYYNKLECNIIDKYRDILEIDDLIIDDYYIKLTLKEYYFYNKNKYDICSQCIIIDINEKNIYSIINNNNDFYDNYFYYGDISKCLHKYFKNYKIN